RIARTAGAGPSRCLGSGCRARSLRSRLPVPWCAPSRVLSPPAHGRWSCHRQLLDALAERTEIHSNRGGRLRQQTQRRHPRQRVRLETEKFTALRHTEVDTRIAVKLERAKRSQRQPLNLRRLLRRQSGREFLTRHSGRVLAFVVVNLVRWENFAHRQRSIAKNAYGELASRNEALDHHLIVISHRLRHRRREVRTRAHDRKPNGRPL